jgi:DNA ligase-1
MDFEVIPLLFTAIKPMLLQKADEPPARNYIHQLKYDGFRCLLHVDADRVKLYTRHLNDCTRQFPEFARVGLRSSSAILDGEMIALGDDGKPDFEAVMSRFQSRKVKSRQQVHFAAFDVLQVNGESTLHRPLEDRHEILQTIVAPSDLISVVQFHEDGAALFESVKSLGLEGIVSKKKGSRYTLDHRSANWLKIKNYQYATVAITGIRKREFGWALQLENGSYAGVCEFVPKEARAAFFKIAKRLVRSENQNWYYLEPLIQCRVKFQCYTKSGLLRSPSFVEFVFKNSSLT